MESRSPSTKDIAPILFEHCDPVIVLVSLPRRPASPTAGGQAGTRDQWCIAGAPFSLLEYQDVFVHAKQIAAATRRRSMPPWLPEPGYGSFANERRLGADQIDVIDRWVAQGAPQGDPADKPPTPTWPQGWQLGEPDLIVKIPEAYTLRATGSDVFRNFVIPLPLPSTKYVRAMEFRTDNPRVLHHASVGVDRTRASRDWTGPTRAASWCTRGRVRNVYGWSPGKAPFMELADKAWTLEAGDPVAQLHMLPPANRKSFSRASGSSSPRHRPRTSTRDHCSRRPRDSAGRKTTPSKTATCFRLTSTP